MDPQVFAAIITAVGGIIAAIVSSVIAVIQGNEKKKYKSEVAALMGSAAVRIWGPNDVFNKKLLLEDRICLYTVNSFEMRNTLNQILNQNPDIAINNLILLVRKKGNESAKETDQLNDILKLWQEMVRVGKIKRLEIITYSHDPDHYYSIFGDRFVLCGHVYFDDRMPTGTTVDYVPSVITDDNVIGQQLIQKFQKHFDVLVKNHSTNSSVYTNKASE